MHEARALVLQMSRALSHAASALALCSIRGTPKECQTYLTYLVGPIEQLVEEIKKATNSLLEGNEDERPNI